MTAVVDASSLVLMAMHAGHDPRAVDARVVLPEIQERFGLLAPALAAWEVAQVVLVKHAAAFGDSPRARADVLHRLVRNVELVPPDREHREHVAVVVADHGLSVYDAAYLACAVQADAALLVTEDRRLLAAGRAELGEGRALRVEEARRADLVGEL